MKLNPVTGPGYGLDFPSQDPKTMTRTLYPLPKSIGSGADIRGHLLILFGAEVFLDFGETEGVVQAAFLAVFGDTVPPLAQGLDFDGHVHQLGMKTIHLQH